MKLALLGLAACSALPLEPAFAPPADYAVWYAELWTACGSTVRDRPAYPFATLRFHAVDPADLPPEVLGRWAGRDIYLAADLTDWPPVVKHELLHAQLGSPGHPPIFADCFFLRF